VIPLNLGWGGSLGPREKTIPLTCKRCGDAFKATQRDAMYCSHACTIAAHRRRLGKPKAARRVEGELVAIGTGGSGAEQDIGGNRQWGVADRFP